MKLWQHYSWLPVPHLCLTRSRLFVILLVACPSLMLNAFEALRRPASSPVPRSCLTRSRLFVAQHCCPPLLPTFVAPLCRPLSSPTFVAHLCHPPLSPTVVAHRHCPPSLPTVLAHHCHPPSSPVPSHPCLTCSRLFIILLVAHPSIPPHFDHSIVNKPP